MTEAQETLSRSALILLAILASGYVAWELTGLRYTNHDDIAIHIRSWLFSGNYSEAAKLSAFNQGRPQHFISMPLALWINKLAGGYWYDVINVGAFGAMYAGFVCMMVQLSNFRIAIATALTTLLLFPLHYYFTFPHGYAVIGSWPPAFGFAAAALLGSHLHAPNKWKLLASVALFTTSLWGGEYNFILHPLLLLLVVISAIGPQMRRIAALSWPYLLGYCASGAAYLAFATYAKDKGADAIGRVSIGFDLSAWLNTFLILQEKAFLLTGLWRGIGLQTAVHHGVPAVPPLLTYSSLFGGTNDGYSVAIVFAIAAFAFTVVFLSTRPPAKPIGILATSLAAIAIIPSAILSLSTHYHVIVLAGYIQGHLVSTYVHIGLSGLLFLCLLTSFHACTRPVTRYLVLAVSVFVLASATTSAFVYNNVNRQVMSANKQKWDAMAELVIFLRSESDNRLNRTVLAPAFWSSSGVSAIPDISRLSAMNYWSEFAGSVLGSPTNIIRLTSESTADSALANYVSTPQGTPVVIFSDHARDRYTLIASEAVSGTLIDTRDGAINRHVRRDDWQCATQCVFSWSDTVDTEAGDLDFEPDDLGSENLLEQFVLDRDGQYAFPFRQRSKLAPPVPLNTLQILNWGPRETVVGIAANPQGNGQTAIWIQTSMNTDYGELRVIFDGQLAPAATIGPELITLLLPIDAEQSVGTKEIRIEQVQTRERILVGNYNVRSK